jgi:RNA methyltransferase, TrmH family
VRITSVRNPIIKYARSLDQASVRRTERVFVVEGVRLVSEAVESAQQATVALYDPELLVRTEAGSELLTRLPTWAERSYEVPLEVLRAAAQTETPAGILAVLRLLEPPPLHVQNAARFGILLDGLSDPGNAGTILRTASAFAVDWVASIEGSVDLFAPKVVRSGMGAHFRLPIYPRATWEGIRHDLPDFELIAADARSGEVVQDFDWPPHSGLVVGGEAHGLSESAERFAAHRVRIPLQPGVESLNASVATSILLYAALGSHLTG